MLEPTKKRRIKAVELCVMVRSDRVEDARRAVTPFLADDETVPWREVYPDFSPADGLRGARIKEGLTQRALSALVGVPQRHISEMENGKRSIGKVMAKRLADALKIDYRVML
ncbi:helix-turn-helix domain-containing protein [Desulfolutivibrio sp.]|uniref:helix-turn-helix domain-containing protein n=1 Tax=Desulfolutivibrio sp. TaxID=2773296 RepID=UPI002F962DD3